MLSPNQEYGRRGHRIEGFIIHKSEGTLKSALDWMSRAESQVSYHSIIDLDGTDYTLVMPENTAWHAGIVKNGTAPILKYGANPNLYTIGIALAGYASEKPTQEQIAKLAKLLNTFGTYYNITLDKSTIVPHNAIRSDKLCPGHYIDFDVLSYLANLPF